MDLLFQVPNYQSLLRVTDNPSNPEQTEQCIQNWLMESKVGQDIYWDIEMQEGGHVNVVRDELGFVKGIYLFGDNGVKILELAQVEDFSSKDNP